MPEIQHFALFGIGKPVQEEKPLNFCRGGLPLRIVVIWCFWLSCLGIEDFDNC